MGITHVTSVACIVSSGPMRVPESQDVLHVALPASMVGDGTGMHRTHCTKGMPRQNSASVAPALRLAAATDSTVALHNVSLFHPRRLELVASIRSVNDLAPAERVNEVLQGPVTWASPSTPDGVDIGATCPGNLSSGTDLHVNSTWGHVLCLATASGTCEDFQKCGGLVESGVMCAAMDDGAGGVLDLICDGGTNLPVPHTTARSDSPNLQVQTTRLGSKLRDNILDFVQFLNGNARGAAMGVCVQPYVGELPKPLVEQHDRDFQLAGNHNPSEGLCDRQCTKIGGQERER
jgi:hypothetical protein